MRRYLNIWLVIIAACCMLMAESAHARTTYEYDSSGRIVKISKINTTGGILQVTPEDDFLSSEQNGQLTEISKNYTLLNTGKNTVSWEIQESVPNWLEIIPKTGTLAGEAAETVTVSLISSALSSEPPGTVLTATFSFVCSDTGQTINRVAEVKIVKAFQITPDEDFVSIEEDNVFSLITKNYTVRNVGPFPINWKLSSSTGHIPGWLSISLAGTTLVEGTLNTLQPDATEHVTISLNENNLNGYAPGSILNTKLNFACNETEENYDRNVRVEIERPPSIVLKSPLDNAYLTNSLIEFSWESSSEAKDGYRLWIKNTSDPVQVVFDQRVSNTSHPVQITMDSNDIYQWFVEPIDANGNYASISRSETRQFTCGFIPPPEQVFPTRNECVNATDINFTWTEVPEASGYLLYVIDNENQQPFGITPVDTGAKLSYSLGGFSNNSNTGKKYYWYVVPYKDDPETGRILGTLSEGFYMLNADCSAPTLYSPKNASKHQGNSITFDWSGAGGEYDLFIWKEVGCDRWDGVQEHPECPKYFKEFIVTDGNSHYTVEDFPADDTVYKWTVRIHSPNFEYSKEVFQFTNTSPADIVIQNQALSGPKTVIGNEWVTVLPETTIDPAGDGDIIIEVK